MALAAGPQPLPYGSEMRDLIERYAADRGSLVRLYAPDRGALTPPATGERGAIARPDTAERGSLRSESSELSAVRRARLKQFYNEWLSRLERLDFEKMGQAGRADFLLFRNHLNHELRQLDIQAKALGDTAPLIPFAETILGLDEARRRMEPLEPPKAAATVNGLRKAVDGIRKSVDAAATRPRKTVANRAAGDVESLRNTLRAWFSFYNGYDPLFTWWVDAPYKEADKSLQDYAVFLREKIAGLKPGDNTAIIGNPIGREALLSDLAYEMIPYSPEELIEIAHQEYAWCEAEMKKASRELGYGEDWHKALEFVKTRYVEPGKQPALIRDLAIEATEFIEKRGLVTIPPLARETWRMEMMSPERQLVNPFFTGGEILSLSYPTNTMSYEQKLMSMRGNNIHFSRATVFHELIPGHHLQQFMAARYRPYRSVFGTPFLTEGWALHWEMLLWDLSFQKSPEDRVGALFWRMHRCARIIFSLGFHLDRMSPEECIELLVRQVGHERDNATAEVRRSLNGSYPPLYQAAYMLGGLQLRALHRELVDSGKMTNQAFHDAVLMENRIPVEIIRAGLTNQNLRRDFRSSWRFYAAGGSR